MCRFNTEIKISLKVSKVKTSTVLDTSAVACSALKQRGETVHLLMSNPGIMVQTLMSQTKKTGRSFPKLQFTVTLNAVCMWTEGQMAQKKPH